MGSLTMRTILSWSPGLDSTLTDTSRRDAAYQKKCFLWLVKAEGKPLVEQTLTSALPRSLTRRMRCPPSLLKSISRASPPLPRRSVFPHVDPETDKCRYSIIPRQPLSPSLSHSFPRSSSVTVLRPALITHDPPCPPPPPDDVWAAIGLAPS